MGMGVWSSVGSSAVGRCLGLGPWGGRLPELRVAYLVVLVWLLVVYGTSAQAGSTIDGLLESPDVDVDVNGDVDAKIRSKWCACSACRSALGIRQWGLQISCTPVVHNRPNKRRLMTMSLSGSCVAVRA